MEAPDIIAVPASSDLSEWLYDRATCYEVETNPLKHTTFDKLVQILRRCYRAGCSKVVIVVPDAKSKEVVELRLNEVMGKEEKVLVAMLILREWLEEVEIKVRTLAKEPETKTEEVISDGNLANRFLEWSRIEL